MEDDDIHSNLQQSKYLLTFNEPELVGQANLSPNQAAQMWAGIETIASAYNIEVVGPCVTQDKGVQWYADWINECNNIYGRDCNFDYTCIHLYYQPYTEDTSERCDSSDHEWACIQQGSTQGPTRAAYKINQWATNYPGKQIWVTEYACAPWGSTNGCSAQEQIDIMNQLTPLLEESPDVFRYSWFGVYGGEGEGDGWEGNGLNENIWTSLKGVGCEDRAWLAAFGTDAGWKIQTKQECLERADTNEACAKPLALSIDDDACYCSRSTDCNLETTWGSMSTWVESASRDLSTLTMIGNLYETFGANKPTTDPTTTPTSSPSSLPTKSPTSTPTNSPTDSPTKSPTNTPTKYILPPCYDYSDILPIDLDKSCTGRSLFLEIRAKYMKTRDAPGSERCPGQLSREIKALTGTTTTKEAHETFDLWCENHMQDWDTPYSRVGPPSVCYDYNDVLSLSHDKCTDRTLFLHIREIFMQSQNSPGSEPCEGGLARELMALTGTMDEDLAHEALGAMCDNALQEAINQADNLGWGKLESEGSINLEEFFNGTGFLNDETGNFQQEESDFLKRGGYEKFIYIGDNPRLNDHYPTTEKSYQGGQTIARFYGTDVRNGFLSSPETSGFQETSCQNSNTALCCWHRDRQYFDKNGNCVQGDCADQNPGDNTDLCWIEDDSGEIFPYPGDESEKDLHCHGFAWAQQDGNTNAKAKWNNLFFVSMYDHLYQRGYANSITDNPTIAGQQAMCGCIEEMNPVARADCTEAVGRVNYEAFQDGIGGPFVVKYVPGTFNIEFQACEGFEFVEDFGPEDYAEFGKNDLKKSNNDLSAYVFRQYLEGKLDEGHVNSIETTLIGYRNPSVNDGDDKRELACQAAFEAKFPQLTWIERDNTSAR